MNVLANVVEATEIVSEHNTTPKAVLVHNPVDYGYFECFDAYNSDDDLQEHLLFRAKPDPDTFREQHHGFVQTLKKAGQNVITVTEVLGKDGVEKYRDALSGNPNFVYTRDAMMTLPWEPEGYIRNNMGRKVREVEPPVMEQVAKNLGLRPMLEVPEDLVLEGGDVIPFSAGGKRILLIGYMRRTQLETIKYLQKTLLHDGLADEIVGFELAPWRINLDGGCVPVSENVVVMHAPSLLSATRFTRDGEENIQPENYFKSMGYTVIHAEKDQSLYKQVCNIFCGGRNRIVAYNITDAINRQLRQTDLDLYEVEGTELVVGTGGPRCMTRPIYADV